jgi:class 3 adenylate cyclase
MAAAIQAHLQARSSLLPYFEVNLTIMFDDLKDSTSYVAAHGDRRWQQLMQQHHDLLHPIIARHHGQVIKNLGDGSLAIFPNAAAAVRAALEIQQELHRHNQTALPENQLHLRLGLHSGRALLSDTDVLGLAVSQAARVCGEANAGEIVISETTYHEAGEAASVFESLGVRKLKGIEGEVRLYRKGVQR